jgi:hypothetical protein
MKKLICIHNSLDLKAMEKCGFSKNVFGEYISPFHVCHFNIPDTDLVNG